MINLVWLRQDPETVFKLVRKKEPKFDIERLYELDAQVRLYLSDVESLRQKKNELAQQGKRGVTQELRDQSIELGKMLKSKEQELARVQKEFDLLYLGCPNIPFEDVPEGDKADNVVV